MGLPCLENNSYQNVEGRQQRKQKIVYYSVFSFICVLFIISVIAVAAAGVSNPLTPITDNNSTDIPQNQTFGNSFISNLAPDQRNLIFMLSDGMGPASLTMARVVAKKRLALDDALAGTVKTYSSSSWVTDSAAGATAYASATKTYNGAIGVDSRSQAIGTVLEAARKRGMPVGLVCTSRITHATPAAFSSHSLHRDYEEFIAEQQSVGGIDVMLGGGRYQWLSRNDGRNLFTEMKVNSNYTTFETAAELRALAGKSDAQLASMKLIGLFADDHMSYNVDRDDAVEPSLAEMSKFALRVLKAKSKGKGFFLMIEGSRIDMAGHSNDPIAQVGETLAYDDAFAAVQQFVNDNQETFVVASSDHETGGLSLGLRPPSLYEYPVYEWKPELFYNSSISTFELSKKMMKENANIADLCKEYNFTPTNDELKTYGEYKVAGAQRQLMIQIGLDFSKRAKIGWASVGHSGVDVNLYTLNDPGLPNDVLKANQLDFLIRNDRQNKLGGNLENTEVGKYMSLALNLFDLENEKTRELKTFDLTNNGMLHVMKRTIDEDHY